VKKIILSFVLKSLHILNSDILQCKNNTILLLLLYQILLFYRSRQIKKNSIKKDRILKLYMKLREFN